MNNRQPAKITALYERLSRDDDDQNGESNSITGQKKMLEDYAAKNSFGNVQHFTDDGYSGGNFDRPGWKAMIAEIEAGNVVTVISKDMSRIGRDYLQTGFYTEVFFREKGVRFIAVSNNIDSSNRESAEYAPFLNIFNEMYLKDVSRKVKASHRARGMDGKRLTFMPIYGYIKSPEDKNKWLVDPEAAEVVRRIFALTIEGKGPVQIARILADDRIERPSYYLNSRGIVKLAYQDQTHPYAWSGNTIGRLVQKPEYMGNTVNFRTYKDSYKDKNAKDAPKEDWVIFENTHEAIVDRETWETAQRCRRTVRRTDTLGEANPLTGLVFCRDCGAKMYNHRNPYPTKYVNKKGYNCIRSPRDIYTCSTYTLTGKRFDRQCTAHGIRTVVIRALALDAIKTVSGFVKSNEAEFVRRVRESSAVQQDEMLKSHKKRIAKEQKRVTELNRLFRKTYEDFSAGRLTEKRFEMLSEQYETEQSELEQSVAVLQSEIDGFNDDSDRAGKFIELVKRHTDFTELTATMIHE
jgi:DNA invertase Pin-like site-specific DNA recombinase